MTSRLALWIALVVALAGAVPGTARADWDDRPEPSEYEESLNPYGYWTDAPGYGRVWRPYQSWDWRPYVDGNWIWSSYGWTWSSPEPWGWTFHYGRWGYTNLYGWVWTPGYVWGPAWVDWYWGDGYVGWVPLAPIGFAIAPAYWTYVHDYSFCAPHVHDVVVAYDHVPHHIINHRAQGWGSRRPPDLRDIEHVSRHRVVQASDRPGSSVAPWVRQRIERGERVRERVADRGGERVIEHTGGGRGRVMEHRGEPDNRLRDADRRPHVSDDTWRRPTARRDDAGGQIIERRGNTFRTEPDDSQRDRQPGVVTPRTRPSDDDGNFVHPRPRVDEADRGMWTRQPRSAPQQPQVERPGMGHAPRGGGGVTFEHGRGGGTPMGGGRPGGGQVMQHGGGGGGGRPSPAAPGGGGGGRPSAAAPSGGGGGGHPGAGGGGGRGGGGSQGGGHAQGWR